MTETQQSIEVSDSWNQKFAVLEKIGANEGLKAYFDNYKSLTFGERFKVGFNILAFIFGPFYYFAKKMWFKGAFLFGAVISINILLTIIETALGTEFPMIIYQAPGAAVCASLANYDFYRFCKQQEKIWGGLPAFFSQQSGAVGFPVAAFLVLMVISAGLFGSGVPKCGDSETVSLVKQIADREMGNQLGREAANIFSYKVGAIRTTSTNEQTGSYECAAQLGITASTTGETNEIPITYTVEATDDGEEFYVNVYGL